MGGKGTSRRRFLRLAAWLGAAALGPAPWLGCPIHGPAGRAAAGRSADPAIRVDPTFAEALLAWLADPGEDRSPLLEHPALAALVRHQQMTGNPAATAESVLDRIPLSIVNVRGGLAVLERWRGREHDLATHAAAALDYLPPGTRLEGTLFLVAGYDIGIAAPPDMALNVAHLHFVEHPEELGPYATHEAHHVGFLARRPFPALRGLDDPFRLADVIAFLTQMEGMAVHAAYPGRLAAGTLGNDGDYLVYTDAGEAARVRDRYREVLGRLDGRETLWPFEIGEILEAMSSGERLWYRFGALVAAELERAAGRAALVDTIDDPSAFAATAAALLGEAP